MNINGIEVDFHGPQPPEEAINTAIKLFRDVAFVREDIYGKLGQAFEQLLITPNEMYRKLLDRGIPEEEILAITGSLPNIPIMSYSSLLCRGMGWHIVIEAERTQIRTTDNPEWLQQYDHATAGHIEPKRLHFIRDDTTY